MIHEGHLGLGKCKLQVKDTVYRPGTNEQLEQLILNCKPCLKYPKVKSKQPSNMSLGQDIPIHSWTKIVTDIFYFNGVSYLLLVNYTSRFPVVRKLTSMTVQHVAGQMKLVLSEYGWQETIISDNRPCYSANTFTKLLKDYSVNHISSSPHYPQYNGLAEKYIQVVKDLFYKAQEEGTDLYKSLMIYRNTPVSCSLQSPMQILQSETTRSQLPMSNTARKQFGLGQNNLEWKARMNSYNTWPTPRSKCHIPRFCNQNMVSNHSY